jgi:hypothetical protein
MPKSIVGTKSCVQRESPGDGFGAITLRAEPPMPGAGRGNREYWAFCVGFRFGVSGSAERHVSSLRASDHISPEDAEGAVTRQPPPRGPDIERGRLQLQRATYESVIGLCAAESIGHFDLRTEENIQGGTSNLKPETCSACRRSTGLADPFTPRHLEGLVQSDPS